MNKGTIAILGDSWAESMWRIESTDTLVNGHIHGMLEQNGYSVHNFGKIGMGNVDSWESYELMISKENVKAKYPDLIIWFHTEIFRDIDLNDIQRHSKRWTYYDLMSKAATLAYKKIKRIIDTYKLNNIFLIEGQAPVVEPEFSKYIPEPAYTIKSWRNKLLDIPNLPSTHILKHPELFEYGNNLDSLDTKIQQLDDLKSVQDAMENSVLFPDNIHPGRKAHEQLVKQILEFMNKTNH